MAAEELRDRRISISVTRREFAQIDAIAGALGTRPASLTGKWIGMVLKNGGQVGAAAAGDAAGSSGGAAWLPPTGAGSQRWQENMAVAVEQLRERYPDLLGHVPADYTTDPSICEPLWALVHWRQQLDAGEHDDPRMELSFNRAVRDLCVLLLEPAGRRSRRR